MGADQPRWYHVANRQPQLTDSAGWPNKSQTVASPQAPCPTHTSYARSAADCAGAMVARSQILVSESTATLIGTMTNEADCDVYFSGMPPYAITSDTDGSEPILLSDFNSPPREEPSPGNWVIHPGASVPYRSVPVILKNPDPRWDGTDWCTSSQSTTMEIKTFCKTPDGMTLCNHRKLPTIQLFNEDWPGPS